MTNKVTFFPDWEDPYLRELAASLAGKGWHCEMADRRGLVKALIAAVLGRRTVHLHWFEGFTPRRTWLEGLVAWTYLPALWAAGRRGRLIWTVHNVVPHEGYSPLVGTTFLRFLARASSRVLVHFDETRDRLESGFPVTGKGKVFVTAPATFGHSHGIPIERTQARRLVSDSVPEGSQLFIQIGQLRAYKNPAITALAFRDSAPESARLLIAGACNDPSLRAEILEAVGEDSRITVRFDSLSNADLVAALCAADWSVNPYRAIDNPGAVNLSVAYGCPVIAPDFPAIRKLTAGRPAILYPTDEPRRKHVADAIALAARSRSRGVPSGAVAHAVSRDEQATQTSAQYLAARGHL